ncbi:MAG: AraC family transcriptional regulator [Flavobacterium sp.]
MKKNTKNDIVIAVKYKWIQFIFIIIVIITIIPIALYSSTKIKEESGLIYQLTSCTILLIASFKIIRNPEILYGYNVLKKKVEKNLCTNLKVDFFWIISNNNSINNVQEIALKTKIEANLNEYISRIENYILSTSFIVDSDLNIENISHKLDIPKSHLNYIFKYHSRVKFIEFKKTIKIHFAMTLIQNDYLKSGTLNSLSKKVGFTSYDPFYRSFKKITEKTPVEYYNLIRSNK